MLLLQLWKFIVQCGIFFLYQTALLIFTYNKITSKNWLKRNTKTSNNTKTRHYSHLKMTKAKQRYKNPVSNLSEFLMWLIEALIIDEFLSKLNLKFPNNKISIKTSIISTVFKKVLRMLMKCWQCRKFFLFIPLQGCKNIKDWYNCQNYD